MKLQYHIFLVILLTKKKFLLGQLSKKDVVVIDVGSNVGSFLDFVIKNLKIKKVYAFEPSNLAFKKLKNKFNQKNIVLENYALSNKNGVKKFYEYKLTSQSSFYKLTSKKTHLMK